MSEISVGSAVGAGFRLIVRKPLSVMAWGLLRVAFVGAVFALYAPMIMSIIAEVAQHAHETPGGEPSQAAVAQMMQHMMVMQGAGYLAQVLGLIVSAVTLCAISRAVVHPERDAAAYLRLGPPEFFTAVISFAAGFVAALGILLCLIPFVIVIAILAAQKLFVAMAIVIGLAVLALIVAFVYVLLRFAFVLPMMVDDGQFHLFDAWGLTKGHVGSLFAIGLWLVGIAIAAEVVLGALMFGLGATALGAAAGGFQNLQSFVALGPSVVVARLAPWLIVGAVVAVPVEGCALAIFIAPWARAYRDVAPPAEPAAITPPPATPPPPEPSPAMA